jgi:DNA-binding response OmpR family regulator
METTKKILLVEDDQNFGVVLRDYLSLNDFEVTLAKNGMEGFEKFKKDNYDLCILDVMMPYKDGYTLAKEIREKNKDIPLIFLTAKSMKEDVMKGYKVGADDYLNKPFDSDVLLMKIKAIIQRKASETKPDSTIFEFTIGKFHLNSKLRFLTFDNQVFFLELCSSCNDHLTNNLFYLLKNILPRWLYSPNYM